MDAPRELHIAGHKIAVLPFNRDKGGTPAVFFHGVLSSIGYWSAGQTPIYRDRFRWYSVSLPGHYPATLPPGYRREELTAQSIAQVLAGAVRELVGERPVILAGVSAGGFAALAVAAHAPEIARGVICISGFAQGRWTGVLGRMQRLARGGSLGRLLFKANLRLLTASRGIFRQGLAMYAADPDALYADPDLEPTLDLLYPDVRRMDPRAMWAYFYQMPDVDIRDILPRIQAPVLVLAGDSDPIVPTAQAQLIAQTVPNADLVLIKGAGHVLGAERPEAYHRAITEWTQRVIPDA